MGENLPKRCRISKSRTRGRFFFVSVNLFFFFYFRVERRAVNLPTKGNRKVPGVGDAVGDAVGSDVCGVPPFLARKCGDASVVGDVAQSPA